MSAELIDAVNQPARLSDRTRMGERALFTLP